MATKTLIGVGLAIPIGYGIWALTRKKNGVVAPLAVGQFGVVSPGVPVATGNLPLEYTWNAITVAREVVTPVTGILYRASVEVAGVWHHDGVFPVTLASGTRVRVRVNGRNTTNRELNLSVHALLLDPVRTRTFNVTTLRVPANGTINATTPAFTLDVEGTWRILGRLREA